MSIFNLKDSKLWIGTWAKNIKAHLYKNIEDYQKVNDLKNQNIN